MAIRRPPTAISLKPSDVTELREFIANRDKEAKAKQQPATVPSTSTSDRDAIVDKEKKDAEEREARGARARVMGQ
ncbi:hypothetical protein JCM16303_002944 [Sporobolomyces ruberrimus]